MFYSDDPVWDYERYSNYCEKQNRECHEEHDYEIKERIEYLECLVEDLKLCKSNESIDEVLKDYEMDINCDYYDDIQERIQDELWYIEKELKDLKEELER